ncbi:hypothetical protein A2246_01490 [candidate division WOR-1 bacterium RIFOXYA2_FULL_37_7]|nr:MAG: hypothetical protein A2246_01490 [candidate division WOR-1 bacterium RIFOXYA2_FULL_37_7]
MPQVRVSIQPNLAPILRMLRLAVTRDVKAVMAANSDILEREKTCSLSLSTCSSVRTNRSLTSTCRPSSLVINEINLNGPEIFPKVNIFEKLECGGMGTLFWGSYGKKGKLVIVKIPNQLDLSADLVKEGHLLSELNRIGSIYLPSFYGIGAIFIRDPFNNEKVSLPYYVMEYIPGLNLNNYIKSYMATYGDAIPFWQVTLFSLETFLAVLDLHNIVGVAHRDLCASNLLISTRKDDSSSIKVIDFGVAKRKGTDDETLQAHYKERIISGRLSYKPPEVLIDGGEGNVDVAMKTDLYALGLTMFFMLTGKTYYYKSEDFHLTDRIPAEALRQIPKDFADIIFRLTNNDISKRLVDYKEINDCLINLFISYGQEAANRFDFIP